jgi:signal transduction histidine kinase
MHPRHSLDTPGILLLGANRNRLTALRDILEQVPARIVLAATAAAAEALVRRYCFHVLAVDVESIDHASQKEMEILRGQAATSGTSVIFLTQDSGPPPPPLLESLGEVEFVSRNNARALILRKLNTAPGESVETIPALKEKIARLEQANEALRDFAWSASHDLKEPLRGVIGIGGMLYRNLAGKLDNRDLELLNLVLESGKRTYALLESMQQFIVIADTGEVSTTVVDCNGVMQKVTAFLRQAINESGASVTWESLPSLQSDESMLTRVLLNLVGNAIKYRSDRPPEVKVTYEYDGVSSVFSVIDNGRGIDPRHYDSIFRPFWRADRRQAAGSGLGLALCRAAVQRSGGQIWVHSGNDNGSVFQFSLPGAAPLPASARTTG